MEFDESKHPRDKDGKFTEKQKGTHRREIADREKRIKELEEDEK